MRVHQRLKQEIWVAVDGFVGKCLCNFRVLSREFPDLGNTPFLPFFFILGNNPTSCTYKFLQLVFVSSDRDVGSFNEYFEGMTFCAIPFEDRSTRNYIIKRFEVTGIPKLIILGPVPSDGGERPIINDNIRGLIESGELGEFPFHKKLYGDLARGGEDINEKTCLMIFHENGDDEEQENVVSVVKSVSEQFKKRGDMRFYWAIESKGMVPKVREALSREQVTEHPLMIILDLPDNGAYYVSKETEINFDNVIKFICGKRKRHQLR